MSADTRLEELGDADSSRLAQISLIIPSRASAVESAAYLLVAEALDDAEHRDASHVTVDIVQDGEWLVITVEDDGSNRTSRFVDVADRVGALSGRLTVERTRLKAELLW